MTIAEKIHLLRRKNGLSQEQFANIIGVSRQAVSKWEQAVSLPDINSLVKISECFGVSVDCIVKDYLDIEQQQSVKTDDYGCTFLKKLYAEKLKKPFLVMIILLLAAVTYNQLLHLIKPPLNHSVWKFALGLGASMWKLWLIVVLIMGVYSYLNIKCRIK